MNRRPNFSDLEKSDLVDLIEEMVHLVENKSTDSGANKEKQMAWYQLSLKFNAHRIILRKDDELKEFWKTLKGKARKYAGALRTDRYKKTGGGERQVEENPLFERVLRIINVSGDGVKNPMDSDTFTDDIERIILEQKEDSANPEVFEFLKATGAIKSWKNHTPTDLKAKISPQLTRGAEILIKSGKLKDNAQQSAKSDENVLKTISGNIPAKPSVEQYLRKSGANTTENNRYETVDLTDAIELDVEQDVRSLMKQKALLGIQILKEKLKAEKLRVEILNRKNEEQLLSSTHGSIKSLDDSTEEDS